MFYLKVVVVVIVISCCYLKINCMRSQNEITLNECLLNYDTRDKLKKKFTWLLLKLSARIEPVLNNDSFTRSKRQTIS